MVGALQTLSEVEPQTAADDAQTLNGIFELLQDYKPFVGVLVAEMVLGAVWSRRTKSSIAASEVAGLKRAKKTGKRTTTP
jgi:hypothetical protein